MEGKEKEDNNLELYGEFIPTFYKWEDMDSQRKIVEKLEKITIKKKEKKYVK